MAQAKTKTQKFKAWVTYYAPEIVVTTVGTAIAGGVVALAYFALKEEKSQQQKFVSEWNEHAAIMNNWIDDEKERGNAIYMLDDGAYLVVPESANAQYVVK